jgi:hypothetical protein
MSCASLPEIFGTAALAASMSCLTLVGMAGCSFPDVSLKGAMTSDIGIAIRGARLNTGSEAGHERHAMILAPICLALAGLAALAAWCAATRLVALSGVGRGVGAAVSAGRAVVHRRRLALPSRHTFSDDSSGKDESFWPVSMRPFVLAFIVAALALWAVRVGWRMVKR